MSTPFWSDAAVRQALALGEAAGSGAGAPVFTDISTDTRELRPGALFVALRGERFDGHNFLAEAFQKGAAAAVVEAGVEGEGAGPLYPVPDTLEALGALARYRRRALGRRGARVVGITGSSGKTTVKEFTRGAVEATLSVHATRGNLNNLVGVPLTLLAAPDDARVLVVEMGTNTPGEIRRLTAVAEPEIGVVTTVSSAHLEGLGSLGGVLREKSALLEGLPPGGWGVVGDEPPALPARARELRPPGRLRVVGWGEGADPDLRPDRPALRPDATWAFRWRGASVELRVPGRHAVVDALLALAVAELLGVPPLAAAQGVSRVPPGPMRGELRRLGGLTLLVDCYNANPQSTRAALETLLTMGGAPRRVAVLGGMGELGDSSALLHREVLAHARTLPLSLLIVLGGFAAAEEEGPGNEGGPEVLSASGVEEAGSLLAERLQGDEVVLLKASRGVRLEGVLPALESRFGPGD